MMDQKLIYDLEELLEWLTYNCGHAEPRIEVVERAIKALKQQFGLR